MAWRGGRGGYRRNYDGDGKVVFVYGYPTGIDAQQLNSALTEPLGINIVRNDFKPQKLMAFVHCATPQDAQALISHWNKKPILGGDKPMQCRLKGQSSGGGIYNRNDNPMGNAAYNNHSVILPPETDFWQAKKGGRSYEPKISDNEGHDELGYAKQVMHISGLDENISYNEMLNTMAPFGPIHLLIAKGQGQFTLRFCYDLSNDYLSRTYDEEQGQLLRSRESPMDMKIELVEDLNNWI